MNNSKMWLVVNPTVGIPIFLGAVAVGSFAVHVAVLSNTTWVSDFLSGQELGSGDASASLMLEEGNVESASYMAPVITGADGTPLAVVLPDGTKAQVIVNDVTAANYVKPATPEL